MKLTILSFCIIVQTLLLTACGRGETGDALLADENFAAAHPDWVVLDEEYSKDFSVRFSSERVINLNVAWSVALDTASVNRFGSVRRIASMKLSRISAPGKTKISDVNINASTFSDGALKGSGDDERRFDVAYVGMSIISGKSAFSGALFSVTGLGEFDQMFTGEPDME